MNLQENIRRILREEVNESTFFRRRVDMSLMEKEFFDILNILTDIYLSKYNHGIDFNFETFEDHVIHYFMDGYYNDLTNGGENDYPFDEVYEFLSNHFHNKIKDRYDTHFGRNINESIRRILKEETDSIKNLNESKTSQHMKLISNLLDPFKEKDCICDIRVTFDVEDNYYNIYLVFSQEELHEKFFNLYGIRSYIQKMMNEVKMELESFLPIRNIFIGYYTKPNCEWSPLNESENKKSGLLRAIEEDGLYQVMQDTGLSLPQIYTKTGELPKEVFEGYIKDFIDQEGYHQTNGSVQLMYAVEIQKNIQIENFYMVGDKVTVEIRGYNDYNEQTDGYIESLSNLTDEEIFTIVDDMINFTNHTYG